MYGWGLGLDLGCCNGFVDGGCGYCGGRVIISSKDCIVRMNEWVRSYLGGSNGGYAHMHVYTYCYYIT